MNDLKLIAAIRDGDEKAIDHAINKYSKLLWSVASAVLKNASSQDVEECVADVFIQLWREPGKFDPARGDLKVWLCTIARSRAIDRWRVIMRRSGTQLDDNLPVEQMGLVEGLMEKETKQALIAAVRALEEPDREILIRRFYYEQKPREIALALDMPVKSVENRLYRTKLRLRQTISV